MKTKYVLALSALVLAPATALAQQAESAANPLDSIDIQVSEDMFTVAQALLESTRTGVPQTR